MVGGESKYSFDSCRNGDWAVKNPPFEFKNLSLSRGDPPVLFDVNMEVGPGEFVCLLGPSGNGLVDLSPVLHGESLVQLGVNKVVDRVE
jgi:ABC-type transporter Mla maintaining outer membrane lipid asymmetry ATPase subunit MlaF